MSTSCKSSNLPLNFRIKIEAYEKGFRLETFQSLPITCERAFVFFQNPKNLFDITPDWLDFRMVTNSEQVFEGAEFSRPLQKITQNKTLIVEDYL